MSVLVYTTSSLEKSVNRCSQEGGTYKKFATILHIVLEETVVVAALKRCEVTRLINLGWGEGRLLKALLQGEVKGGHPKDDFRRLLQAVLDSADLANQN